MKNKIFAVVIAIYVLFIAARIIKLYPNHEVKSYSCRVIKNFYHETVTRHNGCTTAYRYPALMYFPD